MVYKRGKSVKPARFLVRDNARSRVVQSVGLATLFAPDFATAAMAHEWDVQLCTACTHQVRGALFTSPCAASSGGTRGDAWDDEGGLHGLLTGEVGEMVWVLAAPGARWQGG